MSRKAHYFEYTGIKGEPRRARLVFGSDSKFSLMTVEVQNGNDAMGCPKWDEKQINNFERACMFEMYKLGVGDK